MKLKPPNLLLTIFIALIFGFIGIISFLWGVFNYSAVESHYQHSVTVVGTINQVDAVKAKKSDRYTYYGYGTYQINATQQATFSLHSFFNPYNIGQKVTLYYDATDPGVYSETPFNNDINQLGSYAVSGFGVSMLFLTGWLFWHYGFGLQRYRRLSTVGKWQMTSFVKVTTRRGHNATYYTVHSEWTDPSTSRHYAFKSPSMMSDPTFYIKSKVEVLLDPKNPKFYAIDTTHWLKPEKNTRLNMIIGANEVVIPSRTWPIVDDKTGWPEA